MAHKSGLGKGLDALIPGAATPQPEAGNNQIPVDKILPNPRQPRSNFDPSELSELAASIQEHGILQPLIVSQDLINDQYILIAGERRLQAAKLAGLTVVPVIVRQVTDEEQLELALIENVQRTDLSPLETAAAYQQLTEVFNLSHDEIALRVGKSRVAITNTLRLLKLPEQVQKALSENKISEGHARALLGLATPQSQLAALQSILTNDLTVRQTEELVRKLSGERPPTPATPEPAPELKEIEEQLRLHLGTKVSLHHGKNGGSIVIHYYSDEELNNLLKKITDRAAVNENPLQRSDTYTKSE